MSAIAPVPALIPLSLLEAIRKLDTPEDELEDLADEVVTRRLGLSQTVAAQIQRYRQTAERDGTVPADEAISVLRLVGRRADAALAFEDAGRRATRYAVGSRARRTRVLLKLLPGPLRRRLARRAVARVARGVFGGELRPRTQEPEVRMPAPLSVHALTDGGACLFYGSAYGELLRALTEFEGVMAHERCRARGDEACLWRAVAPG